MLPPGAVFEMAVATARITADETSVRVLALCNTAVSSNAELSLAAADVQLVCRLDLALGGVVVDTGAQTLLAGCLHRPAPVLSAVKSGKLAHHSRISATPAQSRHHTGSAMATIVVSMQSEATGCAAMLDGSVALHAAMQPTRRLAYGYVPAIRACAALTVKLLVCDKGQPLTVQVSPTSTATGGVRTSAVSVLDRAGARTLMAAGLAIGASRAASGVGWMRASTAPALITAWRPIATPPASTAAKPAKWLIVSSRPMPLSAICALRLPEQAIIQTSNVVYQLDGGSPPLADDSTTVVRSDAELTAAMTASRPDHIFCVCSGEEATAGGSLEKSGAAAMLWAFRARARSSTTARMSLITFGHQATGCEEADTSPAVAAAVGMPINVPILPCCIRHCPFSTQRSPESRHKTAASLAAVQL